MNLRLRSNLSNRKMRHPKKGIPRRCRLIPRQILLDRALKRRIFRRVFSQAPLNTGQYAAKEMHFLFLQRGAIKDSTNSSKDGFFMLGRMQEFDLF